MPPSCSQPRRLTHNRSKSTHRWDDVFTKTSDEVDRILERHDMNLSDANIGVALHQFDEVDAARGSGRIHRRSPKNGFADSRHVGAGV